VILTKHGVHITLGKSTLSPSISCDDYYLFNPEFFCEDQNIQQL
jgi:hypothetical protein